MSRPRIAIVGSGMIGSTLAYALTQRGHEVTVFEKGPDYPYPHRIPFLETVNYQYANPAYALSPDLLRTTTSGACSRDLGAETVMCVGGSGTAWAGITTRMGPADLRTQSRFGFGMDWPLDYSELEPWLCRAEAYLGVSGSDADNPWAPPRSRPYPLPPFELTADDTMLGERLARDGIHIHTTPQARTRHDYRDRPGCMNFGVCGVCPIGARYSPNYHLLLALATGRCRLLTDVSVRRIVTDSTGRARAVLYRPNGQSSDLEHAADRILVAAAGIESARLLLLSTDARHPDGLGNSGGHVGQHLVFHHIRSGHMHYRERLFPGKVGCWTGQSAQFCDPPTRGRHGGVKIEFSSKPRGTHEYEAGKATSIDELMRRFEVALHCREVTMHAESAPTADKHVTLSRETDRFGDPAAHIHYEFDDFDRRTYAFSRGLFERVAKATGALAWEFERADRFATFAHHMGTCRMGASVADSVVDSFGAVHDTPGLFALGLGSFDGAGGAMNPTLTGVALALRAADHIAG